MRDREARVAGLLYILAIAGGFFTLEYIPSRLITSGNPSATAHNILANIQLLRIGMAGDLVGGVIWLFVVLALYQLLKDVDRAQANLMVILGAFMQVPLYFVNVLNYVAALELVSGATFAQAFSAAQRDALALLFLDLHRYEVLASLVFAGLWLFPFGILVYKSGFLPRILGVWLMISGAAWLADSLTAFLAPQFAHALGRITTPVEFGEIAIMLWLLVIGARTIGRPRARLT